MMRNRSRRQGTAQAEDDERLHRRVRLIAPTDLAGRYEFPVRLEHDAGRVYMVQVPLQGVQQGQSFVADATLVVQQERDANAVQEEEEKEDDDANNTDIHVVTQEMATAADPHHIPYGKFRDGVCSCTKLGWRHPWCWFGCCCFSCALGQILWRFRLNVWGRPLPAQYNGKWTTFQLLTVASFYYHIVNYLLGSLFDSYRADDDLENSQDVDDYSDAQESFTLSLDVLNQVISAIFWLYIVIILCRTRRWIRRRYNIAGNACGDCCCALCCTCCVVCQLGRHTAHYEEYPVHCCTDTGLARGAPEIV